MLEIRHAREPDAQVLTDLGRSTFTATFAESNRPQDIEIFVSHTFSREKQLDEIRDVNRRIEIAWIDDAPVGFFHLFDGKTDPCVLGDRPLELLRLYVDARWHGRGVGPALMGRSLEVAKSEGFQTLWLGVWEHNDRALAFYRKYGFNVVGHHEFRLGTDSQRDLIMARSI
jgi:ribosomal protein S18 acetylase RimI-like enzyme